MAWASRASATATGVATAWEHVLSAFDTSITHGAGLAVIFPAWMRHVWPAHPERFLEFAQQVFGIEPVDPEEDDLSDIDEVITPERAEHDVIEAAIDELQDFFVSMGMPRTLGELGIHAEDIDQLMPGLKATRGERFGHPSWSSRLTTRAPFLRAHSKTLADSRISGIGQPCRRRHRLSNRRLMPRPLPHPMAQYVRMRLPLHPPLWKLGCACAREEQRAMTHKNLPLPPRHGCRPGRLFATGLAGCTTTGMPGTGSAGPTDASVSHPTAGPTPSKTPLPHRKALRSTALP